MRVCFSIIVMTLLWGGRDAAQTPGTAVAQQQYQTGRDVESRNGLAAAEPYYTEAVRICQNEIARNTATRDTYTVMLLSFRRQNRYADVITWGERGLRLYADEFRIMETMGEAYFHQDDYTSSLSYMQRFVNAIPQGERTPVAYFYIGEIYRLTQKYRHADIAYTTAVRLEPNVALWWFRLATVRESSGDREPAVEAYQRALRLDPAYRQASEGLTRIQALLGGQR